MGRNRRVCKYELAFKAFQPKTNVVAESANNNKGKKLWQIAGGVTQAERMNFDQKRREEKTENLLHLICWGPN
ncbi:hypothetical protein SO802_014854 [Lithocarpus litseifolius]|uniref:Uncharacterized protein n=1 Tax=Lithocarpus litseifolius TaxID=425828 RepID=A0AAW2CUI0_9ROSI